MKNVCNSSLITFGHHLIYISSILKKCLSKLITPFGLIIVYIKQNIFIEFYHNQILIKLIFKNLQKKKI